MTTTSSSLKRLLAAAMLFVALPVTAFANDEPAHKAECRKPVYPHGALRQMQVGVSLIGFLVLPDGTVGKSIILSSSGSTSLDQEARSVLSTCVFKPASKDGSPIETWVRVKYVWSIDDESMGRAVREAAADASKGNPAAYLRVSLLLSAIAKTDAERERALLILLTAAELGHPHAQFEAGRHFEKGLGVDANAEKAQQWYQKAAAQGDLLAIQRMKTSVPVD